MKNRFLFFLFIELFTLRIVLAAPGDAFFNQPFVHDIYFTFSQTSYWDSLVANYTADVYMKCDLTIDGTILPWCGVKFKGNSSYNNPSIKKSFKVDLDWLLPTQKYDGLQKFNLNNGFKDPSFLREKLMLDFCLRTGIPAPRCTYARLYINGTYWGLYMFVEEVNKDFLKDWFNDKKGNLFKGDPSGDLKWYGSSPSSYYTKYELKTNETANNWTDLVRLIDKINNTSGTQFYDSLTRYLEVNNAIKAWAATNIFVNLDSYLGSGHNYYIYHDSLTDKFNWIMWDVNEAFGNFNMGLNMTQLENYGIFNISNAPNRPLYNRMNQNTTFHNQLLNEYCNMVSNDFLQSVWFPVIDSLANLIRPDVYSDPNKFFTNAQFDLNIDTTINVTGVPGSSVISGIKSFYNRRRSSLLNQLAGNGCFVGMANPSGESNHFRIFPNPANTTLVKLEGTQISEVRVLNVLGEEVNYLRLDSPLDEINLSLEGLKGGIYFISANGGKAIKLILAAAE